MTTPGMTTPGMRILRAALITAGALTMGYAVLGALTDDDVRLGGVVLFLGAVLVAHDAVLLPVTILVGVLIGRLVPAEARPAARFAALSTLAVSLVALPLVGGWGRVADDPSVLPLPYGRGLAIVLAALWIPAAVTAAVRTVTAARRRRAGASAAAAQRSAP